MADAAVAKMNCRLLFEIMNASKDILDASLSIWFKAFPFE